MTTLWDRVRELPLAIERYELEGLRLDVSTGFTRRTTVVRLHGAGQEGIGEDITYVEADQLAFQESGPVLPLAGEHTLASFSAALPELEDYRRWAFESAALDLALRQGGLSLAEAVGRAPRAVRFVVATRQGNDEWRRIYPELRFKGDAEKDWDEALVAELAATRAIETVDLKAFYRGTPVDLLPDPDLYRLVVEGLPDAWIEDAAITDETRAVLEPHA